jgi:hypothetical protein
VSIAAELDTPGGGVHRDVPVLCIDPVPEKYFFPENPEGTVVPRHTCAVQGDLAQNPASGLAVHQHLMVRERDAWPPAAALHEELQRHGAVEGTNQ